MKIVLLKSEQQTTLFVNWTRNVTTSILTGVAVAEPSSVVVRFLVDPLGGLLERVVTQDGTCIVQGGLHRSK